MPRTTITSLGLIDHGVTHARPDSQSSPAWEKWTEYRAASSPDSELFESRHQRPKRVLPLAISLTFQALVIVYLILRSVTSDAPLPEPQLVQGFIAAAPAVTPPPAPPPPPPPPSAASEGASSGSTTRLTAPRAVLASHTVSMPGLDFDMSSIELGVPGGTEGGIPGGVIGGVVGGLGDLPPPPPVPDTEPIRVGGQIARPAKLVHADPVYPRVAETARVEGLVVLEATIDGEGNVQNLKVLKSIPLLDDAAIEAVRQWKYAPTIIDGKPVPILMTVTVTFSLG